MFVVLESLLGVCGLYCFFFFFFSSRRRHTRCALVTGVQTCALPIWRIQDSLRRLQRRIVGVADGPRGIPGLRIVGRPFGAVPDPLDEIGVADERTAESDRIGGAARKRLVAQREGVVAF